MLDTFPINREDTSDKHPVPSIRFVWRKPIPLGLSPTPMIEFDHAWWG